MHAQVTPDDSRLLRSIPPTRVALIERIANAVSPASKRGGAGGRGLTELQQRFVRSYFRGVGEEDLAERTPRPARPRGAGSLRLRIGAQPRDNRWSAYSTPTRSAMGSTRRTRSS